MKKIKDVMEASREGVISDVFSLSEEEVREINEISDRITRKIVEYNNGKIDVLELSFWFTENVCKEKASSEKVLNIAILFLMLVMVLDENKYEQRHLHLQARYRGFGR